MLPSVGIMRNFSLYVVDIVAAALTSMNGCRGKQEQEKRMRSGSQMLMMVPSTSTGMASTGTLQTTSLRGSVQVRTKLSWRVTRDYDAPSWPLTSSTQWTVYRDATYRKHHGLLELHLPIVSSSKPFFGFIVRIGQRWPRDLKLPSCHQKRSSPFRSPSTF